MMPTEPGPETLPVTVPEEPPPYRWYHKMSAVVFITFCLEIGFFLLVFPWTEAWENNFFSSLLPVLRPYWGNMYVRGAISGIGVVNLYISFMEMFRLKRFSRK
jgi:hypothetical protein